MRILIRIIFISFFACIVPVYAGTTNDNMLTYNSPEILNEGSFSFNEDRFPFADDLQWKYNLSMNSGARQSGDALGASPSAGGWSWHRIFGYSTVATAIATVVTGFVAPGDAHCGLAIASSALGALSCINGVYSYGFPTGSGQYTAHAVMGMLSTAGFASSIFLADRKAHAVAGSIAGVIFTVTVGVVYF